MLNNWQVTNSLCEPIIYSYLYPVFTFFCLVLGGVFSEHKSDYNCIASLIFVLFWLLFDGEFLLACLSVQYTM